MSNFQYETIYIGCDCDYHTVYMLIQWHLTAEEPHENACSWFSDKTLKGKVEKIHFVKLRCDKNLSN